MELRRLGVEHYEREEALLFAGQRAALPEFIAKLENQHAQARELGRHTLEAPDGPEFLALARRFHAISQHNIIEEERDLFPLCDT